MLNVILNSVIRLTDNFDQCHFANHHCTEYSFVKCHFAQCHSANWHTAESHSIECHSYQGPISKCHSANHHLTEYRFVKCHFAECRGALRRSRNYRQIFFPDSSESADDSKPSNDHQVPTADATKRFCFVDDVAGK
jgi:hypothetical protein